MKRMKRLARYLLEVPDPTIRYDSCERNLGSILVYVDSDWAGCKSTRKSYERRSGNVGRRTLEVVE